jgi:chromosome segregation ATPase
MTDGESTLETRVTALESEMVVVRQEVAAARALAAGADRDVAEYRAELRAHTRTLNALRETQLEHYAEHKADVAELKAGAVELKADVAELKAGVAQIVAMLQSLTPD